MISGGAVGGKYTSLMITGVTPVLHYADLIFSEKSSSS